MHILSDEADLNVAVLFCHLSNYDQCQMKLFNKLVLCCVVFFFTEDSALYMFQASVEIKLLL